MSKDWIENVPNYYKQYINLVEEDDFMRALASLDKDLSKLNAKELESKADYKYAPNKWTVKQVLIHICDTERIFQYRALCIARGENMSLPSFDHDRYVTESNSDSRSMASIIEELKTVREASISLFKNMSEKDIKRIGFANNLQVQPIMLAYLMSGHLRHHFEVLHQKYLN